MKFVLGSHVLSRARQQTSLDLCSVVAMELVPPRGYRAHEGKICIATQRFHSGSQTERSALAERTSRRQCLIYAPHTSTKKQKVHAGRSKLLVRNCKVMRSILGSKARHPDSDFRVSVSLPPCKLCENTPLRPLFSFISSPGHYITIFLKLAVT
jgi:hypothetical protein